MMKPELKKEHQWLEGLVGEWACEMECSMGPGQPPMKSSGTESTRSLGGAWTLGEGRAEMGTTMMTLGYDPARGRFVGTFIGSMMTHMWVYDGTLDASGKVLTLDTVGPDFTVPGKMSKYQDIIELKDDGTRTLSSRFLGDDGQWHHFMTATYRRVG